MASRNVVVMQKNGGDCNVSRVKKVHQGSPYDTPVMRKWYAPFFSGVPSKLPVNPDLLTDLRSASRGNFNCFCFPFRRNICIYVYIER